MYARQCENACWHAQLKNEIDSRNPVKFMIYMARCILMASPLHVYLIQAYVSNPNAHGTSIGKVTGFAASTPSALWANIATLRYQNGNPAGGVT
jgi:hypothetical protein